MSYSAYSILKMKAICFYVPNRRLTINGLHGVVFQQIVLFNMLILLAPDGYSNDRYALSVSGKMIGR